MIHPDTAVPGTTLTLAQARSKLAGLHFAKEALTEAERQVLPFAECLLALVDVDRNEMAEACQLAERADDLAAAVESLLLDHPDSKIEPALLLICQGLTALLTPVELLDEPVKAALKATDDILQVHSNLQMRRLADLVSQRWPGATKFWIDPNDHVDELVEVELADGTQMPVKLDLWDKVEPLWLPLEKLSFLPWDWGLPEPWNPREHPRWNQPRFWVPTDYDPWAQAHPEEK